MRVNVNNSFGTAGEVGALHRGFCWAALFEPVVKLPEPAKLVLEWT